MLASTGRAQADHRPAQASEARVYISTFLLTLANPSNRYWRSFHLRRSGRSSRTPAGNKSTLSLLWGSAIWWFLPARSWRASGARLTRAFLTRVNPHPVPL